MDKLEAMNAFVKVVALGSYAEASRALGLTRSAVSKAVMELERILGARLLDRTTRRVGPTEAGIAYYERCVDILASVEETELQVSRLHDEPKGIIKVNAPTSFGVAYLGAAFGDFMSLYPELKVELSLNDRFIDPVEEGFDLTIRIAALSDSSLIARRLAPARRVLVAAPSYVKKYGEPVEPDELAKHRCLNYGHTTTLQRWLLTRDGETITIAINSAFCSNNGDVLRAAALAGHGITKLPTFLVGPDIQAGRLQLILHRYPPTELGIYALYTPNRYLAAKTRVLIDFLVGRFGDRPAWDRFADANVTR
ncbi:MAG TPA: LysR family transcriptional regulator [Xanthobacteraceae bacterium]|nr:LysR family transcriptional regulator [Xanthobacteraceae bacterium]